MKNKGLLTAAIMVAVIMQVLDTTIANVALPHMRASLGASQDEINWVLTSYIVASAIATPLTGWFSDRLGRRKLLLGAVVGFTAASLLCGIATSLEEMVLFRVIQGVCGAMLVPLARATMMDINPREQLGQAMKLIPFERMPSDFRMSKPTFTSSSGSAAREMRMVSPMPSSSRPPSAMADFTVPERNTPASVTPRCRGLSIWRDRRR